MKYLSGIFLLMFLLTGYPGVAQEVRVEPGTNIKVEPGTVFDITDGNLVLESDASGDASLIDLGDVTYSGGGQAVVERFLTEGQWHLISSPVTSAVSGMFLADYLQHYTESNNLWSFISSTTLPLNIMQGFALWTVDAAPTTEAFLGITNTGIQSRSFTQNGDGWNLLGNPYPSAIDWDELSIPAQLNGAFWLWDPTIGLSGDYVFYITGGGPANTTSRFIPSGQGFFVRAVAGVGTLDFNNDIRTHSTQTFYKSSGDDPMLILRGSGNSVTSQTTVRFNENATQAVDRLFDVNKIFSSSPDIPNLYTKSENEEMAINTLPSVAGNERVPVWFRAGLPGTYTITALELETIDPSVPVYLEDPEAGIIQNLRLNPVYAFSHSPVTDREFIVWFTDVMNIDDSGVNTDVMIYASGSDLFVNFAQDYAQKAGFDARIMVYDLSGKLIDEVQTRSLQNILAMPAGRSLYMVKVVAGEVIVTRKIFIN